MGSGKGIENISSKDPLNNNEDNTNKEYFVDVIKRLNKNDNKKYYLNEENKIEIQNAEKKFKNELNEKKYKKDDYLMYDDGNPEIQFFTNKNKLKIARYSWKTENPKAYVFALHGITSHLRNEYLNYYGRPMWAHKKDEMHDSNIESKDKNNNNNNNNSNNNNSNNNVSNENNHGLDKYTNELKKSGNNNDDSISKDNITNTINYEYHRGNVSKDINNHIERPHGKCESIEEKSELNINIQKYTSTSSSNKGNGNNSMEYENLRKNSLKMKESYCMNNESEKSVLNEGEMYETTSSLSCSSSELMDKKTLERKLTMFLSCSSCMSNYNENTNGLNNDKKLGTGSDNEMNSDDNMMVDDDNVLLIDENYNSSNSNNKIKNNGSSNNNNDFYDGCNDKTVYYCSICGVVCNYCNCGERTLSYKNSWIEKLNENNFSFFGIDNQSHGLSEGSRNERCFVEDFEDFISDAIEALEIFISEWKEKNEMKPIIIMGVSMGGCIALRTLETINRLNKEWKSYVKCLILVSPMISLGKQKNKITNKILISATKFLKYFFPLLKVNVKESNAKYAWIKRDSEIDPFQYCGPLNIKIASECVNAADNCLKFHILKYVEESDTDIMVIQSKHDCIVDPSGSIDFMKKMVRLYNRKEEKRLKNNNKKYSQTSTYSTKEDKEKLAIVHTVESNNKSDDNKDDNKGDNKDDNKIDNKVDNKNDNKIDNKDDNKADNKDDNKADNKDDNKADNKDDNKADNKDDNKNDNKGDNKDDNKADNKDDNKIDNKGDNKGDNKDDNKIDNKNNNKIDNKNDNKIDNKNDNKDHTNDDNKNDKNDDIVTGFQNDLISKDKENTTNNSNMNTPCINNAKDNTINNNETDDQNEQTLNDGTLTNNNTMTMMTIDDNNNNENSEINNKNNNNNNNNSKGIQGTNYQTLIKDVEKMEIQKLMQSYEKADYAQVYSYNSVPYSNQTSSKFLENSYIKLPKRSTLKNEKELWNPFDHGHYKNFLLKKNNKNCRFSKEEDKYKKLSIYILKYGCHTLPGEPHTKSSVNILVNWLNNIFH
ncbi:alpha/beta-hydrolase, putative [Plasmodium sp. gorilla clade G3]|nr:alpha/beta-hydrolase, putative [Plasmodium sp. gorilla clade G3]